MNSAEQKGFEELQRHSATLHSQTELSGWSVHTGKHGLYYLHEASGLAFQTLGAAKVAVHVFSHNTDVSTANDDDDDDREDVLSIATCLDAVVSQLHKRLNTLQAYSREKPQDIAETSKALQPRIVDMYDVCSYVHVKRERITLIQEDTLLQRATKLRCQLLLATCAVFTQKLLHRSSYTSGYRAHCMYTLLQELKRTGPDNPALSMLVEPLLPRVWRKELDKQKLLKGDEDTDLYSAAIAEKDMKEASKEEGEALQGGFVVIETPGLAKLTGRISKVMLDALDLVPVGMRHEIETAVAHSVGRGLDAMLVCCQELESKFKKIKYHQDWLHALKQALANHDQGPSVAASSDDQSGSPNNLPLSKLE